MDEHSAAIMRTDDTLRRCAESIRLDAEPLVVVAVGLEAARSGASRVPLTSMRCPTWLFRSLSRPSSTYETSGRAVEPAVVAPVVPVVPAVVDDAVVLEVDDPLPVIAFARI